MKQEFKVTEVIFERPRRDSLHNMRPILVNEFAFFGLDREFVTYEEFDQRQAVGQSGRAYLKALHSLHCEAYHGGTGVTGCTWKNFEEHMFSTDEELLNRASSILPSLWAALLDFKVRRIRIEQNGKTVLTLKRGRDLSGRIKNRYGSMTRLYEPVVGGPLAAQLLLPLPLSVYLSRGYGRNPSLRIVGSDFRMSAKELRARRHMHQSNG